MAGLRGWILPGGAGGTVEGRQLMSWTDERVELLKKLWADGLSASQIAGELGGITRNAVIGKVHRLGLSGRAKSPSSSTPRVRKPRSHMMRVSRPSMRGNTALALAYEIEPEPEPELIENIIPIGQRRTLLELNEATCRWPIGDPASPEFFFCGGPPLTGLPYCHYHSRVAYQPANERRRDRRPPFRQG
jgi:GcrA cell cycle regulator